MQYHEFRDALVSALRDARFRFMGRPGETIDLITTSRQYEAFLEAVTVQRAEPFWCPLSGILSNPREPTRTRTTC